MKRPERGSNFYLGFLFLPKVKREALSAVYGFCRTVDDLVDLIPGAGRSSASGAPGAASSASGPDRTGTVENAKKGIAFWQDEIERLFNGSPTREISGRLAQVVNRYPIPKELFLQVIEGAHMDLVRNRYVDFADLEAYLYRVASAVGLMAIEIFGYKHRSARDYAVKLGYAFQMTNILRDVGSDIERNRMYLPMEDLGRFGVEEEEIFARAYTPKFIELMRFEYERTKRLYAEAQGCLDPSDRPNMRPAEVMAGVYLGILEKIRRAHFDVFSRKISLTLLEKLGTLLRRR